MAFDFKREYKEFYMPKNRPSIVTVPAMNFIAVRGNGDPNQENGDYKKAAQMQLKCLELVRCLFCEVNPIPVKAAMNMLGYDAGIPRLPLTEMTPENQERLKKAMIELGCLS